MRFGWSFQRSFDVSFRLSFEVSDERSDALSFEVSDARSGEAGFEMSDGRSCEVSLRVSFLRCSPASSEASFQGSFQRGFGPRVQGSKRQGTKGSSDWSGASAFIRVDPWLLPPRPQSCCIGRSGYSRQTLSPDLQTSHSSSSVTWLRPKLSRRAHSSLASIV